jgi:hypothetical protein
MGHQGTRVYQVMIDESQERLRVLELRLVHIIVRGSQCEVPAEAEGGCGDGGGEECAEAALVVGTAQQRDRAAPPRRVKLTFKVHDPGIFDLNHLLFRSRRSLCIVWTDFFFSRASR